MRLAIRTRLTLVTAVSAAAVLVIVGAFVFYRFRADVRDAVDAGLRSRAAAVVAGLPSGEMSLGGPGGLLDPEDAFAQVLGPEGTLLASSSGLGDGPLLSAAESADVAGPVFVDRDVVTPEETIPARLLAIAVDDGRVVVVGASMEDRVEALDRLAILLAVVGPLLLAIITSIGWFVTGAALRPIESMRREAAAIGASEPGRRLPVPDTGDEVARLAETLNGMLGRLETAIERERRFAADASHELRTPLANLRVELELALRRSRTADELEAAVRSAAEETERLSRLADDLLVLARAESGHLPVHRQPVALQELIDAALSGIRARSSGERISLEGDVPPGLDADVDVARLGQALGNLLDNAVRHTPSGGRVGVVAERHDGSVRIEVWDTGPGFPPAFLPRAFEPFARPDDGRARDDGGTGLGLAIVRAVAECHGGNVEAVNRLEGGASVVLSFPGWIGPEATPTDRP